LLLCGFPARASLINGNIRNTSGNAYATNALFTPLSTPQADGANIIASTPTNVIALADGSFAVTLKQGNYKVNLGNLPSDTFIISVPNDSATYNLTALVSSQLTYVFPVSPIFEQKINKGVANGYAALDNLGLIPPAQLGAAGAYGYVASQDGLATNTSVYASAANIVSLGVIGAANHATNLIEFRNSSGVIVGCVSSNGVYRSQYDFFAQLTTTDNTTNVIYAFTVPNNVAIRVVVNIVGWNSVSSATYGRIGAFKNAGGTLTQIGGTATLAALEEDSAFEGLLDFSGTQVRIRVAGNTGKTVNWTTYGTIYYAP